MEMKGYEYIIIGTGPGGAPVALELARAGKKVLIIERGAYHRKLLGFPLGARLSERFFVFNRSKEGVVMERGITVGGSSMIYQGNVFDPSKKIIKAMGLDFRPEADEIKNEIGVKTLPEKFYQNGPGSGFLRMREAAEKMGTPFRAQDKFVDTDRCRYGCDWCMLGCPRDAKWTTRRYIDEAVEKHGATLMTSTAVKRLRFNSARKRVEGVELDNGRVVRAEKVVLAAGGIGSPGILLRSGVDYAGKRFFMDPMTILYGISRHRDGGQWNEQTFSHAIDSFAESDGFMIGNSGAWGTFCVMNMVRPGVMLENWYKAPFVKRGMGLFVKLAEDDLGEIYANERTSKPMSSSDITRMKMGVDVAREIMVRGGAREKSISTLKWAGGHPGGTIEMGKYADREFRTEFDNLYVCDASVFPVSPGAPPSLSIMAMSRLLAKFMLGKVRPESRFTGKKGGRAV
ncbi:MAG TPA: GMC family oxidoreductase [Spirochaetota bacterium]|nr:GMC family oxidoreductase [Spirochaetota bacterium]HPI89358.1 GMC family oxidoreductase [Spirochaetota bacterium]HPR48297.1 GMC family oxidoreductase [Spirochaetota bacterium]